MTGNYEYQVGGSLENNAPTYVERQADLDLYHSLKAGDFCYIFNSRQMGKTSLIVRTMHKLQAEGFACTALDFSTPGNNLEKWYAGIAYKLATNFHLANPSEFSNWWKEISYIPAVERLEVFIETVLLASIPGKIVIFIDEIDSTLKLDSDRDDFFALIRKCSEKRNFNSEYHRLTFALVGVATPSDLIADKRRTPFNIGQAIQLDGFKENEIAPLAKGFSDLVEDPLALMREVLAWTGGQPFLTQKVCRLLRDNPMPKSSPLFAQAEPEKIVGWVKEVVRSKIIENWLAHDEPEHLRTIRDRMLLGEQVAGRFLGWYQQILLSGKIGVDNSREQMRFRLTGLVVKQQDELKVYNRIYESVFDLNWVEKELGKLRPYDAVNLQAWVESNYQDESLLLREQALQEALRWAEGKSLSHEDSRYLTASQELKERELEAALALKEEKGRILAQANETLTKAQKEAKRQIRVGSIILVVTLLGAAISGVLGVIRLNKVEFKLSNISKLSELIGRLQKDLKQEEAAEAARHLGLSLVQEINEKYDLQQALLLSNIALAHQNLGQPEDAIKAIEDSVKRLRNGESKNSPLEKEVRVYSLNIQGEIYKNQKNSKSIINVYNEAFDLLQSNSNKFKFINSNYNIITSDTIDSVHNNLIELLNTKSARNNVDNDLLSKVKQSQKEYFSAKLEELLKNSELKEADRLTSRWMWAVAGKWQERSFRAEDSQKFPCEDLRTIDDLWTKYSNQRFGFSVQKSIWQSSEVNRDLIKFMLRVRWMVSQKQEDGKVALFFVPVIDFSLSAPQGQLPWFVTWEGSDGMRDRQAYMERIVSCVP